MSKVANINIIVAVSENGVIGKDNDLPWRLPTDLKYFKEVTDGSIVFMGRKNYESIPEKYRPLPNRTNVVLTRNEEYEAEGCEVRHDIDKALDEFIWGNEDIFIIGGSEIYKECFKYSNKLYLTRVHTEVEGDTYLEGFNEDEWELISSDGPHEENNMSFTFEVYAPKYKKD